MATVVRPLQATLRVSVGQLGSKLTQKDVKRLSAAPASKSLGRRRVSITANLRLNPRQAARQLRLRAVSGETHTIRSVPVQVAKELVDAGHHFVDVRTPEEFANGHVEGAINVPFMYRQNGGMVKNSDFMVHIRERFNETDEMVVGCQSGKRSSMAVTELQTAGFACVTDMGGGFSAWAESGLPVDKA